MLSEDEKREMREMAESASLQKEFRTMRRNSRAIEEHLTVDQVMRWLTTMGRACPVPPKRKPFVHYTNVKI